MGTHIIAFKVMAVSFTAKSYFWYFHKKSHQRRCSWWMHENCPASELLSYCCDSKTQWTNFSKKI